MKLCEKLFGNDYKRTQYITNLNFFEKYLCKTEQNIICKTYERYSIWKIIFKVR